jgi:hypothetical protein
VPCSARASLDAEKGSLEAPYGGVSRQNVGAAITVQSSPVGVERTTRNAPTPIPRAASFTARSDGANDQRETESYGRALQKFPRLSEYCAATIAQNRSATKNDGPHEKEDGPGHVAVRDQYPMEDVHNHCRTSNRAGS